MKELTNQSFRYLHGFVLLSFLFASCNDGENDSDNNPTTTGVPEVVTIPASKISQFRALGGGSVVSEGDSEIIGKGLMWSESPNMTLENAAVVTNQGTSIGAFTSEMDKRSELEQGLDSNTTYFVKAYAQNSQGVSYGEELSFTTMENFYMEGEPVMDIDGNTYRTVLYEKNGMTWMGENLKTTRYQNGDPIPYIADSTEWKLATDGAHCYYENDSTLVEDFGLLYNYYTIADPRGLCPVGWSVPSNQEWFELDYHIEDYSTGSGTLSEQLKESGAEFWDPSDSEPTNYSGFSVRGGGLRTYAFVENFTNLRQTGCFYTTDGVSNESVPDGVLFVGISYIYQQYYRAVTDTKATGLSVRCRKDE